MIQGFHGVEPAMLAGGQTASDATHTIDQGRKIATGKAATTGVHANQPLSSLVRTGLPGGPGLNIGEGHTAQRIAGAMDSAGDRMKYGNPVGRSVGSLFEHVATCKPRASRSHIPIEKTKFDASR